jgi:hypothetical protein
MEKKVATKIPAQSISMQFGHHNRAIQDHLFREETRGRIYSKYKALQLVIDVLHPEYHLDLKFRAEKEFGSCTIYKSAPPSSYKCLDWVLHSLHSPAKCGRQTRRFLVFYKSVKMCRTMMTVLANVAYFLISPTT